MRTQSRGGYYCHPDVGNKIRSGCLTSAFSGAQKRAEMLRHPCILGDPQRQARGAKSELVPNKGEQNQKWLPQPCLLGGPKEGGNATSPLHSRESPTQGNKIRSGCLTPAFSGAQKRAEMVRHPCVLGGPRTGVQKGPSLGQWKKAPQSGGQDQRWPTSGPKVLKPSFFFLEVMKPRKKELFLFTRS